MKKITRCFVLAIITIPFVCYVAALSSPYHENHSTVESLLNWVQNANEETSMYHNFDDGISTLRNRGEILIPRYAERQIANITVRNDEYNSETKGVLQIEYEFPDVQLIIIQIPKDKESIAEKGITEYFIKGMGYKYGFNDETIYTTELASGENISYVKRAFEKNSKDGAYCFLKDGFSVYVSVSRDEIKYLNELSLDVIDLDATSWETSNNFVDVQNDDWFYSDVEYISQKKYIEGITENEFEPNLHATRETIVKALYNMTELVGYYENNRFEDVIDSYENSHIAWAQSKGVINGVGDNKFNPYGNVTRQDFAVMLWRYMKYCKFELPPIENAKVFADDGEIADYAREAVKTLNVLGIMNGKGNDIIDPRGNVTRAEAAVMLHRMMNKMK